MHGTSKPKITVRHPISPLIPAIGHLGRGLYFVLSGYGVCLSEGSPFGMTPIIGHIGFSSRVSEAAIFGRYIEISYYR